MAAEPAAQQTEPVVALTTGDGTERVVLLDEPEPSVQQIDHQMLLGSAWTPIEPPIVLPDPSRIRLRTPARGAFRLRCRPRRPTR